jgi:hypothetical protein
MNGLVVSILLVSLAALGVSIAAFVRSKDNYTCGPNGQHHLPYGDLEGSNDCPCGYSKSGVMCKGSGPPDIYGQTCGYDISFNSIGSISKNEVLR